MLTIEDCITGSLDGWNGEQARICILVFPKRSGRTARLVRMIREEYSKGSFASDYNLFSIPFIEDPEYDSTMP